MATNQTGIAITIKAFLPTGKTLDEQFTALSLVKDAHATGDYSAVLKAAKIDEVKAEQKTRRVEDQPQADENTDKTEDASGLKAEFDKVEPQGDLDAAGQPEDDPRPDFLKKGKGKAA